MQSKPSITHYSGMGKILEIKTQLCKCYFDGTVKVGACVNIGNCMHLYVKITEENQQ